MRLFISYVHVDDKKVTQLVALLDRMGHEAWFDREIRGGELWWARILDAIEACDVFVLALSPKYLTSEACRAEMIYAQNLNKPILPLQIALVSLPVELRDIQYEDVRRIRSKETALNLARTFSSLQDKIYNGEFIPPDPLPPRPLFPFKDKPKIELPREDAASLLSRTIDLTLRRLPARMQWWALLALWWLLVLIAQGVLTGLGILSDEVQRTELVTLMWIAAGVLGLLGAYRGWVRELVSLSGILLGLTALTFTDGFLKNLVVQDTQLFYLRAVILLMISYFAYAQPPNQLMPLQYRGRDQVYLPRHVDMQGRVLGALVGMLNGYLVFGSLWFFMDQLGYPIAFFSAPAAGSPSAEFVSSLPQAFLGNDTLAIVTIVTFLFVLIVI